MVARKTSSTPCRVYKYGVLPPEDPAERAVVDEQLWLAHRYYNDLIEVEHARRQAYTWARRSLGPEELKEFSRQLDEERKDVCNARVRDPEWGPGLRGTCGLYSGTYLLVEMSVEQARKKKGAPPKFRRWRGEGSLGVQCSKPFPVSELMGGSSRFGFIHARPRYQRKNGTRGVYVTLPVGPGGVRATFPMVLHRPLPAGGLVKWIRIVRRTTPHAAKGGRRERWEIHFTIEASSFEVVSREGPIAAMDICWSRGRVGHLLAEDGFEESVNPHPDIVRKLVYADSVRAIRDKHVHEVKEWVAEHIEPRVRSWPRLHARGLIRKTREWREAGHDVTRLEEWRKRDDHLRQIEVNVRQKAKRRLRNDYRVWARRTVDRYPVIVLEDLDLHELAMTKVGGPKRFAYAPSHLRAALATAGAKIVKIPAPFTSRECHRCGGDVAWDTDYHRPMCVDPDCGWEGDRRVNAVRNILASGLVALERPVPLALRGILRDSGPRSAEPGSAFDGAE